jgi:hypothetical protein
VIIGFGVAAVPLAAVGALVTTPICSAVAHADSVAYLTNVTVAPGYNFNFPTLRLPWRMETRSARQPSAASPAPMNFNTRTSSPRP